MENLMRYEMYHYLMDSIATHFEIQLKDRDHYTEQEWRRLEYKHDACVIFINKQLGEPINERSF